MGLRYDMELAFPLIAVLERWIEVGVIRHDAFMTLMRC